MEIVSQRPLLLYNVTKRHFPFRWGSGIKIKPSAFYTMERKSPLTLLPRDRTHRLLAPNENVIDSILFHQKSLRAAHVMDGTLTTEEWKRAQQLFANSFCQFLRTASGSRPSVFPTMGREIEEANSRLRV